MAKGNRSKYVIRPLSQARLHLRHQCLHVDTAHGWFISKEYSQAGRRPDCRPRLYILSNDARCGCCRFITFSSTDSIAKTIFGIFLAEFCDGRAQNFSKITYGWESARMKCIWLRFSILTCDDFSARVYVRAHYC